METLVSDCFPQIFSYLSLADLLHLRTVSRRLKQEVEDYLPTVRSLPLYLTTPRTPEAIAQYENICISLKDSITRIDGIDYTDLLSDDQCFRRLPFGTSGPEAFEDLTILQNQNHFWRSDFLILNHSSALFKFLPFIKKYCPNIEKLALVIDHCDHYLPEVSKVLKAFPTIKVLLVESTMQDACRHYDDTISVSHPHLVVFELLNLEKNLVKLPPELYDSIQSLNCLEELYLFSKRQERLLMSCRVSNLDRNLVKSLFRRLKVLHLNANLSFQHLIDEDSEETLEGLSCPSDLWFKMNSTHLMFPRLKKLILLRTYWSMTSEYVPSTRPLIKFFDISHDYHSICPLSTQNLNYFTGLESFHCGRIDVKAQLEREPKRMKKAEEKAENFDVEIVSENLKNWTIKHLQVIAGSKTPKERNRDVCRWSKYFVALETCTFLEPEYSVVRVSDLQRVIN